MQQKLLCGDFIASLEEFGTTEWIKLASIGDKKEDICLHSALISPKKIREVLKSPEWDLCIGMGYPSMVSQGKEIKYEQSPYKESGIEPLVFRRSFDGIEDAYWEVQQEICLYYGLFDKGGGKYIYIHENGDKEEVIRISAKDVEIKLWLIKDFISVKKLRLILFFEIRRFENKTLEELAIEKTSNQEIGKDFCYSISRANFEMPVEGKKSFGRLMGKKIISASRYRTKKNAPIEFIIGVDQNGNEISISYDLGKVDKREELFLRQVCFNKAVMNKYYSSPKKYSVEDGLLRCADLWMLPIDNSHPTIIIVYLGDLANLPYKEKLYWRSFNEVPGGNKISSIAYMRNMESKFVASEKKDFLFKQKFVEFNKKFEQTYGWFLFKTLNKGDEHHFKALHIPLTNDQNEFDQQILSLTKVSIDSINVSGIKKWLQEKAFQPGENDKTLLGIDLLEVFLSKNACDIADKMEFLKNLQKLRSCGVAHRKGSKYKKAKKEFGLEKGNLSKGFDNILGSFIELLDVIEKSLI